MTGGRADPAALERAANGRSLMPMVLARSPSNLAGRSAPIGAYTNGGCGAIRAICAKRSSRGDKGVCAVLRARYDGRVAAHPPRAARPGGSGILRDWGIRGRRSSLWDADHVTPRRRRRRRVRPQQPAPLLCLRCHRKATADLRERLRRRESIP